MEGVSTDGRDGGEALAARMTDAIGRQRAMGYGFAIVYVTPEEKQAEASACTLRAIAVDGVRIPESVGIDNLRLAAEDPAHEFFMATWGDPFGLQRARDGKAAKAREVEDKARAKVEAAEAKAARAVERAERKLRKEAEAVAKAGAKSKKAGAKSKEARAKAGKAKPAPAAAPKAKKVAAGG